MIPKSILAVLLVVTFVSCNNTTIDCSAQQHSCFGTPVNCQPETDCNVLFHFDPQGNLDVKMRDVVDFNRYIAVAVSVRADLATEYVICIPHQQRRMRGVAKQGEPIQIVEQHMARYVRALPNEEFVCTFLNSELPDDFNMQDVFYFSDGIYSEKMIIPSVEQLQPIVNDVYTYPVAARSSDESDSVLTREERKRTSDLLGKMRRISGGEDADEELGALLGKKHRKSEESEDEGEEEDLDDMLDSGKKYSTRRRQEQKKASSRRQEEDVEEETEEEEGPRRKHNSRSRPSRYEEDEEDEEEEIPKKKSRRPTSRRANSDEDGDEDIDDEDEDVKPKRKNDKKGRGRSQKDEEDDYEDEKESDDDDYDNSSNGFDHFNLLALIAALVFFMIDN